MFENRETIRFRVQELARVEKMITDERIRVRLASGDEVRSAVEAQPGSQLTRKEVTAAVHCLEFEFTSEQVESFATQKKG